LSYGIPSNNVHAVLPPLMLTAKLPFVTYIHI